MRASRPLDRSRPRRPMPIPPGDAMRSTRFDQNPPLTRSVTVAVGSVQGCDVAGGEPKRGDADGRRPTIRDVAERAGVSKSLVSLVMRGEPMVREDKRRRVRQAADELGYRMNLAARSLSNVRSRTVGVLVADLQNPLLVAVVEWAGQVFEDAGLSTLLADAVMPSRRTTG